ncbi:MAG: 30S ribosomal protein S20 [Alphaproteobacteria bacterium CG_4_10_14_0_2_um_filter_63_37]|nr:MAG: 30S ribosomal protein S20 [Proteobacteria bacterium CG1_02_64_396]PJA25162.1 MAG: 30S ribosomal protein S20 [Alphaproteobacteria bacterium CG_4_10_14_0_2_um_filter_63_37]
MANHASAKKRIRQTAKRNDRNRANRSALRTAVKGFRSAVETGGADATNLSAAISAIDVAARKGAIPRAQANRRKSRLAQLLNKAAAAA